MPNLNMIGEKNFLNNFLFKCCFIIAENANEVELSRLLQLVLGCAVTCDRKEFFIERIMSMEKSIQLILMNAIQEVIIRP